jgi:hypothetical protein
VRRYVTTGSCSTEARATGGCLEVARTQTAGRETVTALIVGWIWTVGPIRGGSVDDEFQLFSLLFFFGVFVGGFFPGILLWEPFVSLGGPIMCAGQRSSCPKLEW